MAHKAEHVSTEDGFSVLNDGTKTEVIAQDGTINATVALDDDSVTTAKIADDAVTTVKILDDNVTTAKILDDNITSAKILADNITTVKILDANVTLAKLAVALQPSHVTKFAGEVTWTGGLITLATVVTGVLDSDIVTCSFSTIGTEGVVLAVVPTADTLTFTLDTANTTNDAVVSYNVLRATA